MKTAALRFSNVYGPYSLHKDNAIPNFIRRCLRGERLEIYGDGSQTRDFIHVHDLCDGIIAAVTADEHRRRDLPARHVGRDVGRRARAR